MQENLKENKIIAWSIKSVIPSGFNKMIKGNAKEITGMDIANIGQQIWITENNTVIQSKNKRISSLLNAIYLMQVKDTAVLKVRNTVLYLSNY